MTPGRGGAGPEEGGREGGREEVGGPGRDEEEDEEGFSPLRGGEVARRFTLGSEAIPGDFFTPGASLLDPLCGGVAEEVSARSRASFLASMGLWSEGGCIPGRRLMRGGSGCAFDAGCGADCSVGRRCSSTKLIGARLTCDARLLRDLVGIVSAVLRFCGWKILGFFSTMPVLRSYVVWRCRTEDRDPAIRKPLLSGMSLGVRSARLALMPSIAIFNFSASASRARWTWSRRSQYTPYQLLVCSGSWYFSHSGISRLMSSSHNSSSLRARWGDVSSMACCKFVLVSKPKEKISCKQSNRSQV